MDASRGWVHVRQHLQTLSCDLLPFTSFTSMKFRDLSPTDYCTKTCQHKQKHNVWTTMIHIITMDKMKRSITATNTKNKSRNLTGTSRNMFPIRNKSVKSRNFITGSKSTKMSVQYKCHQRQSKLIFRSRYRKAELHQTSSYKIRPRSPHTVQVWWEHELKVSDVLFRPAECRSLLLSA